MRVKPGATYCFTKSGNEVRAVAASAPYLGQFMWEVERISGVSAGKRMVVPVSALERNSDR